MKLTLTIDAIQRGEGGRILAGLIRFCGDFDRAEDALQEAYTRALTTWPESGIPSKPAAWLTTVARRAAVDFARQHQWLDWLDSETLESFSADANGDPPAQLAAREHIEDDLLRLIFTCCHPALAPTAQTALALRTICQLTVPEIARAYVEPESTTAQRLVRAKRKIADAGIAYEIPSTADMPSRMETVLSVIYLVFNEGYTATQSSQLIRIDLCEEAIRLASLINQLVPNHAELMGLSALMRLHHARRGARVDASGELMPLEAQDRSRWDHALIADACSQLDAAVLLRAPGPYQIEAAIAALHCRAARAEDTDWKQISMLYGALWRQRPTDIVALNAAVAHAMAFSLDEGLARIERVAERGELARYHLLHAARADLLRRMGDRDAATKAYREAISLCENAAELRYLEKRLLAL